jgi:TolB-like protein/Flp pilus assembly protein TadD
MTEHSKAVFLSYASEDTEAARRICESLRTAGIEVWFDQSELRGGDAWDTAIRRQIRNCGLFIPIISSNAHAREEGYFRLEWKLAIDRSHLMTGTKPFLLPVVIDNTPGDDEFVPDKFRDVQWTRLPGGTPSPAFVERVGRLLSPDPYEPAPAQAVFSAGANAPRSHASRRIRTALLLIAASAVIGLGYVTVEQFLGSKRPAAGASAQSAIPEKSIAVLPFVNMSSDKEQEYFSDGLTEEMIDLLSQIQDLRVPARTSSFSFKGKADDIATIAQKLRVAHVLEGSVRKSGNTMRVTVQLIRADSGYHLWSKTYDRDFKDIFKVQDEIAAAVVEELKVKLGPTASVAAYRSSNTEAYNQFLLGRHFYERRNPDGWRRAIQAFHQAITLDPRYAKAYAGLAMSEAKLADVTGDAAALKQAEADAEQAIALDPKEADGYATRGYFRSTFGWDWVGAQADFAKALELDPSSATVQHNYAGLQEALGRLPAAIATERKAIEFDPLSTVAWNDLGLYLTENRDYAAAGDALRRSLEIQPDSAHGLYHLARLQLLQGQATQALATFQKVALEAYRLQGIAMAEHTLKAPKESQLALDELIAKSAQEAAYQIAEVFAWRGENDLAFAWLERAFQQRDGGLAYVKVAPMFERQRGDPRFKALIKKMNLPE